VSPPHARCSPVFQALPCFRLTLPRTTSNASIDHKRVHCYHSHAASNSLSASFLSLSTLSQNFELQ